MGKHLLATTLHPGEGHVLPFAKTCNRKVYETLYDQGFAPDSYYGKSYVDRL